MNLAVDNYLNFVDKYLEIATASQQQFRELLKIVSNDGKFSVDPNILMSTFIERLIGKFITNESDKVREFWTKVMKNPSKRFLEEANNLGIIDYTNTRYRTSIYSCHK
jgi:hypothetical protein